MIHSNIKLDGYQLFIHLNSQTLACGGKIYEKNSISFNTKLNISIDLRSIENMWIEIKVSKKN